MKKKYIWIIATIITLFIVVGAGYFYMSFTVKKYDTTFYPGIKIENHDLTAKTKQAAIKELAKITDRYNQINLTVQVKEKSYQKQLKDIGVQYDVDKTIKKAFQYGKNEKLVKQYSLIKNKESKNYPITYTVDEKLLQQWILSIEKEIKTNPINATITINNGNVNITKEKKGFEIDQKQVQQDLEKALQKNNKKDIAVTASFKEIDAPITEEKLASVRKKIGTFTTHYSTSDFNRNTNIKLATQTINSYLLMPGESFSFNDYVGDTTADKGYKGAGSYLNGQVVDSLGGGVCQVSTTLYNAIIKAGITPDVRYNHSMQVHYVPIGQDAAIAYPYKDLKFTNHYDSPIYIEGTVGSTSVTFTIYADANAKPANTTYQLSSSVVSQDANATKSVTYLETVTNGKVTDRKRLSRDSYAAHK
ncbi:VanW family protein [Bacillus massiliigorillae]|uniref:VanW family protein n=1 Tax=Bacillus massiliigorillae TaxID=1243664 RepID=UPI0003A1ADD5|nr:VanW family protein [Bacillus massiliigorillae]